MDMVNIGMLGVAGVLLALTLKHQKPEYSFFISLIVCMIIFTFLMSKIRLMLDYTDKIGSLVSSNHEYISVILKMIGITYMAEFSSNICKDAGYHAIASQIEMFAKVAILILSMPVLLTFLDTIGEFL